MTEPDYSISFTAQLAAASNVSVGDVLVYDSSAGYWVVATAANRGTKRSQAIARTASGGAVIGSVAYQSAGVIPASVSGLNAGAKALVRCSSTGRMERVAAASVDPATDDIVGYAEADGRVHLMFGLPLAELETVIGGGGGGGGGSPGGSDNQVQYNNGGAFGGNAGLYINESTNRPVMTNGLEFAAGTADAFRMVVDGTPTASRVVTIPDATTTLVGSDTTQTLTNKTIDGASNTLSNVPKASVVGAPSGAFVGTTDSQTLTNKTIDGASNTITNVPKASVVGAPSGSFVGTTDSQTLTNKSINAPDNTITNIANSNVSASAAIAGTKISPNFGAQDCITSGYSQATYFRAPNLGPAGEYTPPSIGFIRMPYNNGSSTPVISVKNFSGTDTNIIDFGPFNALAFGNTSMNATYSGVGTTILGSSSFLLSCNASVILNTTGSTGLNVGAPLMGYGTGTLPFRLKSASFAIGAGSIVLNSAQMECPILRVTGSGGGDIIAPDVADSFYYVVNGTGAAVTIKKSGGTGVTIAASKAATVYHNGTDYVRLTPDA